MSFWVRTETGMGAGSTWGKQWQEARDMRLPWDGSSNEQPRVASVLRSLRLFWESCAFMQDA